MPGTVLVHLNPVQAGLVEDPAKFEFSGHREILGQADFGLAARNQVLSIYGSTEAEALRNYGSALATVRDGGGEWLQLSPGRLPWWGRQVDRSLDTPVLVAWGDESGRPNREARPRLLAQEFVEVTCAELGMSLAELVERGRRRDLTKGRFLVAGLGIERWGQHAAALAEVFGRRADYVSWWGNGSTPRGGGFGDAPEGLSWACRIHGFYSD